MSQSKAADRPRKSITRFWPIAAILVALALAYGFGLQDYLSLQAFLDSREALRALVWDNVFVSALAYVGVYACLVAIAFPAAAIVTIAAGFLFGWLIGGALTVVAATIGATGIFLAARHSFGDLLREKAGGGVRRFAEGFRDDAFSYLLVLRLTPILPFFVVNIAPAFVDISVRTYVLATFLGIIPGTFVYAFLGSGIDQAVANAGQNGPVSIGDLVTPEMTIALFGLGALAILGVVLKKTFFKGRGSKPAGEVS